MGPDGKKAQGAQRIDICSSGKLESIPLSLHFQCVDIHLLERRNTVGARYSYPFPARRRLFLQEVAGLWENEKRGCRSNIFTYQ